MALVASVVNCVLEWFTVWRADNRADQTSNSRISEQQRAFSEGRQLVHATAALHALVYTMECAMDKNLVGPTLSI